MERREVVTCFLMWRTAEGEDRLLILRRSQQVGTYPGRWAAVSGYREREALAQAYQELEEETGLDPGDVRLLRAGEPLAVDDPQEGRCWLVYPFLFKVLAPEKVRTDWEHVEARWVAPRDLPNYETVPMLAEALGRVYEG